MGGKPLEKLATAHPQLVITDIMMPVTDGFALLEAIRSNPETSDIPVIMLSARAGEESRVEGLEHGADDYLIKPFTARELLARVNAHIAMYRTRREAASKERQLRTEIENQQVLLQAALVASETGTFSRDPATGEYFHVDESLRALFGVPAEAVVTNCKQFLEYIHPDDREALGG